MLTPQIKQQITQQNTNNENIALSVRNIHKSFGSKKIHAGLSFDLKKGEILALLGGSGTGKSVMLRSIIGLETPDSGQILFNGKDLNLLNESDLVESRIKIAYVFQNGALFDSLSVEQNISYPLQEHSHFSQTEIHTKVNEMLELIDMKNSNNLLPNELSGGMQKRVGLARAIILGPEIILFDEPTAGLDPINTKRLVNTILTLKKKGITGIFVTHDIPSALEIADRIAILYEKKIYAIITPDELKNSQDPILKSFLSGDNHDL